jgi:predicted DNA-binding transcriptional regulator AlpA
MEGQATTVVRTTRIRTMSIEATSIADFCQAHGISRALFYLLRKRGQAPKTLAAGRRRLVSAEAAAAWRRAMEEPSADEHNGKA